MDKQQIKQALSKLAENTDKLATLAQLSDEEFEEAYENEEATTSYAEINDEETEEREEPNSTHGLRFDDLKSAFRKFSGDNKTNISTWVVH